MLADVLKFLAEAVGVLCLVVFVTQRLWRPHKRLAVRYAKYGWVEVPEGTPDALWLEADDGCCACYLWRMLDDPEDPEVYDNHAWVVQWQAQQKARAEAGLQRSLDREAKRLTRRR